MPWFIGFVPTPPEDIDGFFKLTSLSASDVVYDLGSGDGRLLFAALEKGAGRAVGIELQPKLVRLAKKNARGRGLQDRVTFLKADAMEADLTSATVLLCYLSPSASAALKAKLESELKPGTKVIMEEFPVPGWKPVRTVTTEYREFYGRREFYLYVMPPQTEQYSGGTAGSIYFDGNV
jgi:SAM-dependent methyltransferase